MIRVKQSQKSMSLRLRLTVMLPFILSATKTLAALTPDINAAAVELQILAKSKDLTTTNCADYLKKISDELYTLPANYFKNDQLVQVVPNNSDAINQLFRARLMFRDFYRQAALTEKFNDRLELTACANQLTILSRNIRELEDLVGLNSLAKTNLDLFLKNQGTKHLPFVDNQWPMMLISPQMSTKQIDKSVLKSGDILLSRGVMPLSAPISRIGKIDSQFTHLSFIYIDDGSLFGAKNKNKMYVVESEPDFGLQVVDFERYIRDTKSRVVLFRYAESSQSAEKSAQIAAAAAKFVAEKANPRVDDILANDQTNIDRRSIVGNNMPARINYNYSMDFNDDKSLFCSQVIAYGFQNVCETQNLKCQKLNKYENTKAKNSIPVVSTQFDLEKNALVRILGLKNPEIFSPVDIEVEPRFEMLAEWRNYDILNNARYYDMAISKVFQYSEELNYDFIQTETLDLIARFGNQVGVKIGRLPDYAPNSYAKGVMFTTFLTTYTAPGGLVKNILLNVAKDKPENIQKKLVAAGLDIPTAQKISVNAGKLAPRLLNQIGLVQRLEDTNEALLKKTGRNLSLYQMDGIIDQLFIADCNMYIKNKSPIMIHDFFRRTESADKTKHCDAKIHPLNTVKIW